MGVIPGSSNPVPEGGNSPSVGGVGWMQDVTEQGVKDRAYNQVFPSMQGAKNSLFGNFIGGIFSGFLSIFRGGSGASWLPSGVREVAEEIRDGQLDLSDRADLLAPLLNYGSAFCDTPNTANPIFRGTGVVPFNKMIGYSRKVELTNDGGLMLGEKGTWNIEGRIAVGQYSWDTAAGVVPSSFARVNINVHDPAGGVHSRQSVYMPFASSRSTYVVGATMYIQPSSFNFKISVQVPDSRYVVKVHVESVPNQGIPWAGGSRWTGLTAQNISSSYFEDAADGGELGQGDVPNVGSG